MMLLRLCVLATAALCGSTTTAALDRRAPDNSSMAARAIDIRGEHIMVAAARKRMVQLNSNGGLHRRAVKRAACPVRGSGSASLSSSSISASRPALTAVGQQGQPPAQASSQPTPATPRSTVVDLPEHDGSTTQPTAPKSLPALQAPPPPPPPQSTTSKQASSPPSQTDNGNDNNGNNGGANGNARAFWGNQNNAILSWFRTNSGSDSTNGMSWCETHYRDDWVCFAPSVGTMRKAFGWDDRAAAKHFCGREAVITDTNTGKSINAFICDGFDDKWVRTPTSLDLTMGAFTQLFGRWTDNKNDVITGATWRLTGGVQAEGTFRSNGETEG